MSGACESNTRKDKRERAWRALMLTPNATDRAIGRHIGCSHTFVAFVRKHLISYGVLPVSDTFTHRVDKLKGKLQKSTKRTSISRKELRELTVKWVREVGGTLSNREIGRQLGCSHTYIGKIRGELVSFGEDVDHAVADESWKEHVLFRDGLLKLESMSERTIRAIKQSGVIDYMYERYLSSGRLISPRYAQAEYNKLRRQNDATGERQRV